MKPRKNTLIRLSLAILCSCLAFSTTGCGEVKYESPDDSFIAFVRNEQIWTARADGTGQKQLTEGWDEAPAVSPDGKTIIYINRGGRNPAINEEGFDSEGRMIWTTQPDAIYAVPSGGGTPVRLTPESWLTDSEWTLLFPEEVTVRGRRFHRNCLYPSFSPDGKSICFVISENSIEMGWYLAVAAISTDGTGEPEILYKDKTGHPEDLAVSYPRYSPDGSVILFYLDGTLHELPAKGGTPSKVAGGDSASFGDGYSISNSDGTIVLVESTSKATDPRKQILLMDLDESNSRVSNRRAIYTAPKKPSRTLPDIIVGYNNPPSFSPSGETIVFSGWFKSRNMPVSTKPIYLIPTRGGEPNEIIRDGEQPCFGTR